MFCVDIRARDGLKAIKVVGKCLARIVKVIKAFGDS